MNGVGGAKEVVEAAGDVVHHHGEFFSEKHGKKRNVSRKQQHKEKQRVAGVGSTVTKSFPSRSTQNDSIVCVDGHKVHF